MTLLNLYLSWSLPERTVFFEMRERMRKDISTDDNNTMIIPRSSETDRVGRTTPSAYCSWDD